MSYYNSSKNEHNSNLNNISNIQLKEFGQTPEQIFFKPHPKKLSRTIIEIPLNTNIENDNKSKEENLKIKNNLNEEKINQKETKENNEIKHLNNIIKDNDIDSKKENEFKVNNKEEIKSENIINVNINKIEKYNINGNIISKPFPIDKGIDFKLKKQYKSVKKYDDSKLTSGALLPENNLIISGGINGHLNIYDYYSGEITKTFSLSFPIENINSMYKNNLILFSSDYSIKSFNISSGTVISSFYAHETKIFNLYYDEKAKNCVSCTKGGIIHLWDINKKLDIPIISHFLFDQNNLINVDYNKDNQFFYSLDNEGKISILNIYNDEEIYNWIDENKSNKPITISANLNNINEFIIGYEKGFKIYDVRKYNCVEDWTNNIDYKVDKCIIDSNNVLIKNDFELKLINYKEKNIIEQRKLEDKITFFNFYNYSKNDTRIIYGDEKGNIFYSVI